MDYDGGERVARDLEQLDQSVAGVEPGHPLAGVHLVHAGLPVPLPGVPLREPPGADAGRLPGINTSPAFSPDGEVGGFDPLASDGNPEVYVLNLATGACRGSPPTAGIDTEPTWSPTGREIAFVSERAGGAHVFVMDAEGANVRRLTQAGFNTQPRWSPQGGHHRLHVAPGHSRHLGRGPRRVEPAPPDQRAAATTRAPRGPRTAATSSSSPTGWRAAGRSSPCSPTAAPSSPSRKTPGNPQVLLGRRDFRDTILRCRALTRFEPSQGGDSCASTGKRR